MSQVREPNVRTPAYVGLKLLTRQQCELQCNTLIRPDGQLPIEQKKKTSNREIDNDILHVKFDDID